jgi:NADPH2:quinone reductase
MKAILCKEYGPPESLVFEEVPDLRAAPGKVVVDVKACGVNFPDTLMIQGKYQFKPEMPFSPGGEAAGIVREVGEGVASVKPGDRVIAFTGHGGFAEQVVADAAGIIPIPDAMDFPTASGFVMTYGTSYHALADRARIAPGETLLVLGAAGGVGLTAVELGTQMGARVIAAASSKEKLEVCKDYGAAEVIDYTTEDLRARIKEITGGNGVDVVYDPVGAQFSEPALRSIAWNGRYLVIGFAAGDIPKIPLNLTLLKGCSIVGVFWGAHVQREPKRNAENLRTLVSWWAEGKIRPLVSQVYPLAHAADALNDMLNRRVKGKVVLVP